MSTPKQALDMATKAGDKMVDVKFVDTFGTWQHFTLPFHELNEDSFSDGLGFDGSSIRGWKSIEASDMLAMPDPATAFIDPFMAESTLSLTCTIAETGTKEAYTRDPRGIAQRAEKYLQSTGIADSAVFGPEAEFFIFDSVQFDAKSNGTFYSIDSEEGIWNTGRDEMPNLGYKIRHKEGYFPVAPLDTFGVHAIGGTLGALLTGVLARNSANANLVTYLKDKVTDSYMQPLLFEQIKAVLLTLVLADANVNSNTANNLADVGNKMDLANYATQNGLAQAIANHTQWIAQVKAIGVTLVLAILGTIIVAYIVKAAVGLRADEEVETVGLDLAEHGEEGYHGA